MSVSDSPASSSPSEQVRAFDQMYDGGPPPWDIGRPQSTFVERQTMSRCGRKLFDGRGPDRIVNAMEIMLHSRERRTESIAA